MNNDYHGGNDEVWSTNQYWLFPKFHLWKCFWFFSGSKILSVKKNRALWSSNFFPSRKIEESPTANAQRGFWRKGWASFLLFMSKLLFLFWVIQLGDMTQRFLRSREADKAVHLNQVVIYDDWKKHFHDVPIDVEGNHCCFWCVLLLGVYHFDFLLRCSHPTEITFQAIFCSLRRANGIITMCIGNYFTKAFICKYSPPVNCKKNEK